MPYRPFSREQDWLFPPSLDELIPQDHVARFVVALVESLSPAAWQELGISLAWQEEGAPAYHPIAMVCVWVYGFMIGLRTPRKLERACYDQLPFLWLTGWQHPDHNTLWRFYKAHRQGLGKLFKRTVKTALSLGLVDLAVQAIDGTRIAGNAARARTLEAKGLAELLERLDRVIARMEAEQQAEMESASSQLLGKLARTEELREQVRLALAKVATEEGPKEINLTDPEAVLVKGRQGVMAGYNAQAAVCGLVAEKAGGTGLIITAEEVVAEAHDYHQAVPMMRKAEETTGQRADKNLFDGGYHSGENLAQSEAAGYAVLMAESQDNALKGPYHKDRFEYNEQTDSYRCPEGETLSYRYTAHRKGRPEGRVYRATGEVCRRCPAFGRCTKDKDLGRSIEVGPHEAELRRNRASMAADEGKALYRLRKELPEPVFGIMKELQGARRFLLRGLANVRAEWALLAAAFNLRTLYRVWLRRSGTERAAFFSAAVS